MLAIENHSQSQGRRWGQAATQYNGEQTDGCQREEAGGLGEKGGGVEKYRLAVTK